MTDDPTIAFQRLKNPHPRRARGLMLQGTASDVGKSLLVAGLCRAYTRRGLVVRPFKAQNMSNNAAVTLDGEHPGQRGEIGRAQALQARACKAPCSVHMNPVLLKPESDIDCQVVLRGQVLGRWSASAYQRLKPKLMPAVLDSLERLGAEADLLVVEGAGCGAERYLRAQDITNMALAEAADLAVCIVADESRGGVMAALLGMHGLLDPSERQRVIGYIVNKFRGDPRVFDPAAEEITARSGWANLGLVGWFDAAGRLPAEDSLALEKKGAGGSGVLTLAVPRLSRIANFDDLDPLAAEPGVRVIWVAPGQPIPRDADVIVLPGSKATRADLAMLRAEGWDIDILAHVRQGGRVVGLCAGFQMLGKVVRDPQGIEGPPGESAGLGLLDIETVIGGEKRLVDLAVTERRSGCALTGYEMHMGTTQGPGLARPWLVFDDHGAARPQGACSADGRVMGAYVHGIFAADGFRAHWLGQVGAPPSSLLFEDRIEGALDALADHCEAALDLDRLWELARR
ncbi:cobyric acid synthase CobQ [Rhodospirillum rubrum]|uniref:cobyric acid synthase n=1 Tax=Rhodospirillum rubrum TaxID=1085 RepID=UPI0019063A59|nr:cobyric acid synthase [Rhodospirillum rubrum]MBK1665407.1 cobyric acid synthase CobQ [Rhodospirillum rubrum]MBK1677340.1 cobyric acid synthase CobQ [Rhodospirillum rubrum]